MKRQGGFTLIELVVVIVILGILAVTAAPRFLDLQGDARQSSLQGLKGAIDGAAGIVYGKAAINGVETAPTDTAAVDNENGVNIPLAFGYPQATAVALQAAVNGLENDWTANTVESASEVPTAIRFSFDGNTKWGGDGQGSCYVQYQQASSSASATTTVVDNDC